MKTTIPAKLASPLRWKRSALRSKTRRVALASLLAVCASSALADSLTISVGLTDYLTYGISPYQGPRAYGIEAGGISNIISAGLVYRGNYVPGQWGDWIRRGQRAHPDEIVTRTPKPGTGTTYRSTRTTNNR